MFTKNCFVTGVLACLQTEKHDKIQQELIFWGAEFHVLSI